jgi:hypothetical protein
MKTRELNQQLRRLWTTHDVCRALSVTPMTVQNWRRKKDLPAVVFPGNARASVRFVPEEVESWAKDLDLSFKRPIRRLRLEAA